jgi:gliding motility-associated-like protein
VTNDDGCTGTASISIRVGDPPCNDDTIFLPNAFTPNDDGVNDILFIRTSFDMLASIDLHIYNRWGEEVFKTNNINIGWDGKYKGEKVHPDVFGYYMNIGCPNQKDFFKKGNITLLW